MTSKKEIKTFHEYLNNQIIHLENIHSYPLDFYRSFLSGKYDIKQSRVTDQRVFDYDWIDVVESYFPSIIKIVSKFKVELTQEEEIVAVEKARKTDKQSVQHLLSHSYFVKTYDKKNGVMPEKILIKTPVTNIATYENRFIKHLIERLYEFIYDKYTNIVHQDDISVNETLNVNSEFKFNDLNYQLEIKLNIEEHEKEMESIEKNKDILDRISSVLETIRGFHETKFFQELRQCEAIIPPIRKTQILAKNIDYHNAYKLWFFLDEQIDLQYKTKTIDEDINISRVYQKKLLQNLLSLNSAFLYNKMNVEEDYKYIVLKDVIKKETNESLYALDNSNRNIQNLSSQFYNIYNEDKDFENSLIKLIENNFKELLLTINHFFDFESAIDEEMVSTLFKRTKEDVLAEAKERLKVTQKLSIEIESFLIDVLKQESKLISQVDMIVTKINREQAKEIEHGNENEYKSFIIQKDLEMIEKDKEDYNKKKKAIAEQKKFITEKTKELKKLEQKQLSEILSQLTDEYNKKMTALKKSYDLQEKQKRKKHQDSLKKIMKESDIKFKKQYKTIKNKSKSSISKKQEDLQKKFKKFENSFEFTDEQIYLNDQENIKKQYEDLLVMQAKEQQDLLKLNKQLEEKQKKELMKLDKLVSKKIKEISIDK